MVRRGWAFLGGSFDPVHYGHLMLAHTVYKAIPVQRVWLMPAGQPWQKKMHTNAFHRQTMLRDALQYEPYIGCDDREILRSGPTYTIDTVRQIRAQVGPSFPLVWVLGWDQWTNFSTWKSWQELIRYVHLLIVPRQTRLQKTSDEVQCWSQPYWQDIQSDFLSYPAGSILQLPAFEHSASSTKIRRIFARNTVQCAAKMLEHWLPQSVLSYILQHRLY